MTVLDENFYPFINKEWQRLPCEEHLNRLQIPL